MSKTVFSKLDTSELLNDQETIALVLSSAAADNNPQVFAYALEKAIKAQNISKLAEHTGIGRTTLYRTISGSNKMPMEHLFKIFDALGLKIQVTARDASLHTPDPNTAT